MKAEQLYKYESNNQIWRILISDSDKLIIETRDTISKEVFFSCLQLENGNTIFNNIQLKEKYWIGIETVYKDLIFFHKFPKPDLPGHKEIIVYDISTKSVLWENNEFAFLFILKDKVYCYRQNYDSRSFFLLDCKNGNLLSSLGENYKEINRLRELADQSFNYKEYIYPKFYDSVKESDSIFKAINSQISTIKIEGEIEYSVYKDLLFFTFHFRDDKNLLVNNFCAYNLTTESVQFSDVINENINMLMTDSFFIYKNFLLLLTRKNGLIIYKLD